MSTLDKALATQLKNIETKTGRSVEELTAFVKASGLQQHGAIRDMLKSDLGLGHGDANTLTHIALQSDGASAAADLSTEDVLAGIYSGPKADLRPIHEALMAHIDQLGSFEIAPKKGYVSLRRKKQFAMIGPATKSQVEVGLNMKGVPGTDRLVEQAPGGMCQYKVRLGEPIEVDDELVDWIRTAYEGAG